MADLGHELTDDILEDLEKRLAEEYRKASTEMEKKLREYLDRFADEDAIQRELLRDGQITAQDYSDWRFRHMMMNKRWEQMRDTLAEEYHRVNQIAQGIYRNERAGIYALNHNYALYQIENGAGIDTGLTLYNRDAVERIFTKNPKMLPPPGKKVSQRIAEGKDILWNNRQIQSVMVQGILQGESIPKLARRLEQVTERNYTAAVRNARTMATGAQNAGRHEAYERAENVGVHLVQEWQATLDGRTRHDHRTLHGQRVPVDEPFKVDGYEIRFPGDPTAPGYLVWNCRCTTLSWVKGFEGETVKSSPKMGDMDFEEWQGGKDYLDNSNESGIIRSANEQSRDSAGPDSRAAVAGVVGSAEYRNRISCLGENERITNIMTHEARTTLWRRNGTPYEDLIFVNPKTGEALVQRSQNKAGEVGPTEKMKRLVYGNPRGVIAIHNHPHNNLPSRVDLESAKHYKYGVVACHDGTVIKYSVSDGANTGVADALLDYMQKDMNAGKDITLSLKMLEEYGVRMEVFR